MAEYSRVFWSKFKNLNIVGENTPNLSFTEENWKDTDFYAVGASYQLDDQWKLRLGLALDKSAVGDEYRTPRIPDADRIWYSAGLEYQYNEKLTFNLGYTYIHADKSKVSLRGDHIGDASRGALNVDYSNRIVKGQHYQYAHDFANHWVDQQYLPDAIRDRQYYQFGDNKNEQAAAAYWQRIKGDKFKK